MKYVLAIAIFLATSQIGSAGLENQPHLGPARLTYQQESQTEAKVVLNAPTKARVGELVRFDLNESIADSVKWLLIPGSQDFETYDDGRRAVFSARAPGDYMFIIAVAKGGTVDVVTHVVHVEGPPPKPTDNKFSSWIPYWLYPANPPVDQVSALAASFAEVADRITALSTPKGIIEATAEANREALGENLDTWKPFLRKIQVNLENRSKSGELKTPEQHKAIWSEIARGLRKYAE